MQGMGKAMETIMISKRPSIISNSYRHQIGRKLFDLKPFEISLQDETSQSVPERQSEMSHTSLTKPQSMQPIKHTCEIGEILWTVHMSSTDGDDCVQIKRGSCALTDVAYFPYPGDERCASLTLASALSADSIYRSNRAHDIKLMKTCIAHAL